MATWKWERSELMVPEVGMRFLLNHPVTVSQWPLNFFPLLWPILAISLEVFHGSAWTWKLNTIYASSLNLDLGSEPEGTKEDRCVRHSTEIVKYLDLLNKNNTIYS